MKKKKQKYVDRWAREKKKMIINGTLEEYREGCRLRVAAYRQRHKVRLMELARHRMQTDECLQLKTKVAEMMRRAIKNKNYKAYIPYLEMWSHEFRAYMKGQFSYWMNFSNHGPYNKKIRRWNIDHRTPLASANGDIEKLKKLLHFTNVRPKCAHENISERHN